VLLGTSPFIPDQLLFDLLYKIGATHHSYYQCDKYDQTRTGNAYSAAD